MRALIALLDRLGTALYDLFCGPGVFEKELRAINLRLDILTGHEREQARLTKQLVELADLQLAALAAIRTFAEHGQGLNEKSARALSGIADRIGQIGPHT